jgi:uncharacterized membrane protein YeaQ/YmgE (transglycosylase-associated protein family)
MSLFTRIVLEFNKFYKKGGVYMSLLVTLILAAVVGWIASIIMHTDAQMGWLANIVVGIIGGFIGTALLGFIAPATPTDNGLSLSGMVVGVLGACIAIFIWKAIATRRAY